MTVRGLDREVLFSVQGRCCDLKLPEIPSWMKRNKEVGEWEESEEVSSTVIISGTLLQLQTTGDPELDEENL